MKLRDAIGKTFNHIKILERAPYREPSAKKKVMVRVRCLYKGCGEEFDARLDNVVSGSTKSCGCAPRIRRYPRPSKQLKRDIWKAADRIAQRELDSVSTM